MLTLTIYVVLDDDYIYNDIYCVHDVLNCFCKCLVLS